MRRVKTAFRSGRLRYSTLAIGCAFAALTAPTASAQEKGAIPPKVAQSGNKGVTLTISGQINRAVLFADDSVQTDTFHVDNDYSSTRLRFAGKGDIDKNWSVGTNLEVQLESNSSGDVSNVPGKKKGVGKDNFTQRKLELYIKNKQIGKLTLGQGDTASNSAAEQDLSDTTVVGKSEVKSDAKSFQFRVKGTDAFSGITVGNTFDNLDGLSRDDRIRYDTPSLAGFSVATSNVAGGNWDAALGYKGEAGALSIWTKVAFADIRDADKDRLSGSVSVLHKPSGLSLTAAAGQDEFEAAGRDAQHFYYGKVGFQRNFFKIGKTAFAADYFMSENDRVNGDESTSYGVQLVQKISKVGAQLYVGVRHYEYEDPTTTEYEGLTTVLTGMRIKF